MDEGGCSPPKSRLYVPGRNGHAGPDFELVEAPKGGIDIVNDLLVG